MVPPCWYEIRGTWHLDACSLTCKISLNVFLLPLFTGIASVGVAAAYYSSGEMVPKCVITLEVNKTVQGRLFESSVPHFALSLLL